MSNRLMTINYARSYKTRGINPFNKRRKYKMEKQMLLASPGMGTNGDSTSIVMDPTIQKGNTPTVDYDKVATMIASRNANTEETILKSYLKKQGISGEEMEQAIMQFKDNKIRETEVKQKQIQDIIEENKALKAKVVDADINRQAMSLNVNPEKMGSLLKVIDRTTFIGKNNTVNNDHLKTAIEHAVKEFPDLLNKKEAQRFKQIGAPGNEKEIKPSANTIAFDNGRIVLPKK